MKILSVCNSDVYTPIIYSNFLFNNKIKTDDPGVERRDPRFIGAWWDWGSL